MKTNIFTKSFRAGSSMSPETGEGKSYLIKKALSFKPRAFHLGRTDNHSISNSSSIPYKPGHCAEASFI